MTMVRLALLLKLFLLCADIIFIQRVNSMTLARWNGTERNDIGNSSDDRLKEGAREGNQFFGKIQEERLVIFVN